MPDGLLEIIAILSLGYILLLLEIFVPGGILGVLGGLSILYGTYLAFGLSTLWGLSSMVLSIVVTVAMVVGFLRSRAAKRLVLDGGEGATWKAPLPGLKDLVGQRGVTLSPLRPAGLATLGNQRVDVVSDSEFLDRDTVIEVIEVEGNRVVVAVAPNDDEAAPSDDTEDDDNEDDKNEGFVDPK
jgi:membrane-bound serine protease (ClpP class)